jgi:SAM-dependent methyltransferase
VSGFDPDWLALREPYDHAARDPELAARFAASLGDAPTIVDLGCGTGSNLRYLAPRLGREQSWICVDHDQLLLRAAIDRIRAWAAASGWSLAPAPGGIGVLTPDFSIRVRLRAHDLSRGLPPDLPAGAGVSASALLDLTSAAWLEGFAERCRQRPLLLALSFDGRLIFSPADEDDEEVRRRFLRHQRTDKGFGPALGPAAARAAVAHFERVGYAVTQGAADWIFGPQDREIQIETLSGWAAAARDGGDVPLVDVIGWLTRRRDLVAAGRSSIRVGHLDLFARPTGSR